jgi:hypothetical protein
MINPQARSAKARASDNPNPREAPVINATRLIWETITDLLEIQVV